MSNTTTKAKTNATTNTDTKEVFVPLSRLIPSPQNVRRYQSEAGITELAASISAHGVIQSLRVRENNKNKLEVVAGARRLKAIHTLLKAKQSIKGVKLTNNTHFQVSYQEAEDSDTEISLAENQIRENMHVADQIEAFHKLHVDEGKTPEEIGDRFGVSHMTIRRRLKLANLSPRIIAEFREDNATIEQLMALAITNDHAKQEAAFFDVEQSWQRQPHQLKHQLTDEKLKASDRIVQFITLKAYEKAGGEVTRDLFSDQDEVYLHDRTLVAQLLEKKVINAIKKIDATGWKWIEFTPDNGGDSLGRIHQKHGEASKKDGAILSKLKAEWDKLDEEYYALSEEDEAARDKIVKKLDAIQKRTDEIEAKYIKFDEAEMSYAGLLVKIDHQGKLAVDEGRVKPEDAKALTEAKKGAENGDIEPLDPNSEEDAGNGGNSSPSLSMAVVEDLTALKTVALGVEVANRPDVALCVAIHALGHGQLYANSYGSGTVQTASELKANGPNIRINLEDEDNNLAFREADRIRDEWIAVVPAEQSQFWDWLLEQKQPLLMKLFAFLIGQSVNVWQVRHSHGSQFIHAEQIAQSVDFDMRKYWKPSDTFFGRVPVAIGIDAMSEANAPEAVLLGMAKGKKAEAVKAAVGFLPETGWLPKVLRTAPAVEQQDEEQEFLEAAE